MIRSFGWLRLSLAPLFLGGLTATVFLSLLAIDTSSLGLSELASGYSARDAQAALGNLPEVIVAILGIAVTVVSIILQLSATRYTPRVTELFFRDRTNLAIMGYFVITALLCIWVSFAAGGSYLHPTLTIATLAMITGTVLVLMPYFVYVFAFLNPERVIHRIKQETLGHATKMPGRIIERKRRAIDGIEQLADIAVNALAQKDRTIAAHAVNALRTLLLDYVKNKSKRPAAWTAVDQAVLENPEFTVLSREGTDHISQDQVWFEWKILRQFQTIFNESINRMREVCGLVAINTRQIGSSAIETNNAAAFRLAVRFFNTYLRSAINQKDVRTAYNVMHQYRQLAEAAINAKQDDAVQTMVGHFRYYGWLANSAGLSFVTETVAHDFCRLCEHAHQQNAANQDALIEVFLDVDKAPETESEERSLRGVRKAQIRLACYYLSTGEEERARRIHSDMAQENPRRLSEIREELLEVTEPLFWEVIDRGVNFDYLDDAQRSEIDRFYSWFS